MFFFYLLFLFLPTQLGKHFWPAFAFVEGIRVDYLSPTLYVTDILAVIFILFTAKDVRLPKILFPVLLFVAIGIFLSSNPAAGWYTFAKFVEYLLLGIAIAYTFKKQTLGIATGVVLGIGIIFESFLALFQFLHHGSLGGLFYFLGERTFSASTPGIANASINGQLVLRPYATLPHPNVLAGFLLISLLLVIGFLGQEKSKKIKAFLIIVCSVGFVGILLTLSRSVILLTGILGVFFLLSKGKGLLWRKRVLLAACLLCGIIFVLSFFFPLFFGRFNVSLTDESLVQREALTVIALNMVKTHPLFGVGFGNFFTSAAQNGLRSSFFLLLQPVHNIFFFLAATGGLPFLGFVLWFLWKTIVTLFVISQQSLYARMLLVSLISIILLGQVDHYFVTVQQGQLLTAFVLGLVWNTIRTARHERSATSIIARC